MYPADTTDPISPMGPDKPTDTQLAVGADKPETLDDGALVAEIDNK